MTKPLSTTQKLSPLDLAEIHICGGVSSTTCKIGSVRPFGICRWQGSVVRRDKKEIRPLEMCFWRIQWACNIWQRLSNWPSCHRKSPSKIHRNTIRPLESYLKWRTCSCKERKWRFMHWSNSTRKSSKWWKTSFDSSFKRSNKSLVSLWLTTLLSMKNIFERHS